MAWLQATSCEAQQKLRFARLAYRLQGKPELLADALELMDSCTKELNRDYVASFGPWLCFLQAHIALINHGCLLVPLIILL